MRYVIKKKKITLYFLIFFINPTLNYVTLAREPSSCTFIYLILKKIYIYVSCLLLSRCVDKNFPPHGFGCKL